METNRIALQSEPRDVLPPFPATSDSWESVLQRVAGEKLSYREIQVAARRLLGKSDHEISAELRIKPSTTHEYVTHILYKLNLSSVREIPFACFHLFWQHYYTASRKTRP